MNGCVIMQEWKASVSLFPHCFIIPTKEVTYAGSYNLTGGISKIIYIQSQFLWDFSEIRIILFVITLIVDKRLGCPRAMQYGHLSHQSDGVDISRRIKLSCLALYWNTHQSPVNTRNRFRSTWFKLTDIVHCRHLLDGGSVPHASGLSN